MKILFNISINLLGVLVYTIAVALLCMLFDYAVPKLIELGWAAYLVVTVLGEGIIVGTITLFQFVIGSPFYFLIKRKFAKITCSIITFIGLLYSIIIPWKFGNTYGFSLIVFIWCFTLSIIILSTFFGLLLLTNHSRNN